MESRSVVSARPTIAIDGQPMDSLSQAILRLTVVSKLNSPSRCEISFANWGIVDGKTGFLFFDRNALDFGKHLMVSSGPARLFEGRITAIKAEFPHNAPPTLAAVAEDRVGDPGPDAAPISFVYGQNLREFSVTAGSAQSATGRGTADAEPRLRAGSHVDLQGIGPLFSGKYLVAEVQHVFEPASGLRSIFSVQR